MAPGHPPPRAERRKAVNVGVDPDLLAEARRLRVPISATLDAALRARIAEARRAEWLEENADAIDAYNHRVAAKGTFGDAFRRF